MCTSAVFLAGEEVSSGYRLRLYSVFLMLCIPIHLKSRRKKSLARKRMTLQFMADLEICPRYSQFSKSTPSHVPDRFLLGHLINEPQFPLKNPPDWLPWILVVFDWTTASLSGGACLECPGASTFGKDRQTDRQSYAFMGVKAAPSSHKSPGQWNQTPVTLIIGGRGGEKAQSDASKADRACATTLTADRQRDGAPCC